MLFTIVLIYLREKYLKKNVKNGNDASNHLNFKEWHFILKNGLNK